MTSTSEAGNFSFSFAAAGISPVSTRVDDLLLQRVADPGQLGRPARHAPARRPRPGSARSPAPPRGRRARDSGRPRRARRASRARSLRRRSQRCASRLGLTLDCGRERRTRRSGSSCRPTTRPRTSRRSSPRARRLPAGGPVLIVDDSSPDGTGGSPTGSPPTTTTVEVLHRPGKAGPRARLRRRVRARARPAAPGWSPRWTPTSPTIRPTCRGWSRPPSAADLVLGSRYVAGGGVADWGALRRLISRGGSAYARAVLGLGVHDLTGGFKVFRREVLEAIDLEHDRLARLRVPGRDHLPRDPRRVPRGRGPDHLLATAASGSRR